MLGQKRRLDLRTRSSRRQSRRLVAQALLLLWAGGTPFARADGLPLDPSNFTDLSALLAQSFADETVRMVGALTDHRAYDPAANSGSMLEAGIELTLIRVPQSFITELESVGLTDTSSIPPSLPLPRLHARVSLGPRFSVGASALRYQAYEVYGGDVKLVVAQPTEGVSWALRLAYSQATLGVASTRSWTPQVLLSKPLTFAEPYLGLGYQLLYGKVTVEQDVMGIPVTASKAGTARQPFAFLGLQIRPTRPGFLVSVEGAYNPAGLPTLGAKVGLTF